MDQAHINIYFHPAFILIAGAFLIPFLNGKIKSTYMLLLPAVSLFLILNISYGDHFIINFLNHKLILCKIDKLSRIFGCIFSLVSFIATLFALKSKDNVSHICAFIYAGAALGVTFAGDFLSLYIFWEIMAVASAFLIFAGKTEKATAAGFRYILIHILGGLFLLAGIVLYVNKTGSMEIDHLTLSSTESYLIFLSIAINAAICPLHSWLSDSYPEATATGAVFLSAFTTKSAVYLMARIFAGTELLIWLGVLMTAIPLFFIILENDIRRVLAYSLINQIGFMMCGIGIGTTLAINGTVSHAFCHILYKSLLFMSAGAVLHVTGKIKCTDLGGLYKYMPFTCIFCIIGAASMSAPLFSGFISKSMIISAAAHNKLAFVWAALEFASVGVFVYAGIKVPYFMFFNKKSEFKVKEAPLNMLFAMGTGSFLCIFIGVFPEYLYNMLPYEVNYIPYTSAHVIAQLQLLMFGALSFYILKYLRYYPKETCSINLDFDWFYRKGSEIFYKIVNYSFNLLNRICDEVIAVKLTGFICKTGNNLPLKISNILINLYGSLFIKDKSKTDDLKTKAVYALKNKTVPIGLSAAFGTFFITVIFFVIKILQQ